MARFAAPLLVVIACLAVVACGGDDDSDSSSATGGADGSADASGNPDDTASDAETWTGELTGGVAGTVSSPLVPQCAVTDDIVSVTLAGQLGTGPVAVNILSGGTGSFDLSQPSDESPTVDVAIASEPPAEWFASTGTGDGELILEDDASGSLNATLPSVVTGTQDDVTIVASWTCPEPAEEASP